jgi:hypothetical protein
LHKTGLSGIFGKTKSLIMAKIKKCTACGEWNKWEGQATINCEHCGALQHDQQLKREATRKAFDKEQLDKWIFTLHATDSALLRFAKRVGNIIYMIFMAIVGFIAWLAAVTSG